MNYTGTNKNKFRITFAGLCLALLSIFLAFSFWFSPLNQKENAKKMLKRAQSSPKQAGNITQTASKIFTAACHSDLKKKHEMLRNEV